MADQRSDRSTKNNTNSDVRDRKRGPMYHKQNQEGWDSRNRYGSGRMETFPKTRTFPKNWDLSSFSNESE
jgi:hypothetical protein